MPGDGVALELLDGDGQTVGNGIDVHVVDLFNIACEDDLGAFSNTGDDGLELMGIQVLGLINDDVGIGNRAATDERHCFDLNGAVVKEHLKSFLSTPALLSISRKKVPEVVLDWSNPRFHLLFHRSWEVTNVLSKRLDWTTNDQALVLLAFHHLVQSSRNSKKGLSCSSLSNHCHQRKLRVQKGVNCAPLPRILPVDLAWSKLSDLVPNIALEPHQSMLACFWVRYVEVLVLVVLTHQLLWKFQFSLLKEGIQIERPHEFSRTAVKTSSRLCNMKLLVVVGSNTKGIGLQTEKNVPGNQDGFLL